MCLSCFAFVFAVSSLCLFPILRQLMRGRTDISEIKDNGSIDSTDRLRIALIFIHIHEFKMAAGVAWECLVFPSSVKEKIKLQSGLLDKQPLN